MEIRGTIPKFLNTKTERVNVDEELFKEDLLKFINNVENLELFDQELYDKIVNYGINKIEFDKMIEELKKFSETDDDKDFISFPFESWIDKLLEVYIDSSIIKA